MDEIGEKLDALLNDPKQFGKIAQLASSILGDGGGKQAPPSAPEPELDVDMGQLRRMMSALRGGGHLREIPRIFSRSGILFTQNSTPAATRRPLR